MLYTSIRIALFSVSLILLGHVQGQSDFDSGITCFGFGGGQFVNNTQCPGSNACCGYTATCLSNRLCHNTNDPAGTFVRGPCLVDGWSSGCAQICLSDETTGFLPRVNICEDGSYCCASDAQCCQAGRGTFLDASGNIIASTASSLITAAVTSFPPINTSLGTSRFTLTPSTSTTTSSSSSSSSTSSPSSTGSSSTTPTSTSSASTTTPTNSSSSSSSGVSIGVGVGVSLGVVLVVAGLAFFFFRRRKRHYTVHTPTEESYPLEIKNDRPAEMYTEPSAARAELHEGRPSVPWNQQKTMPSELA